VLSLGRPRRWRFWHLGLVRSNHRPPEQERSSLLYLGERPSGHDGERRSPLLVLGLHRARSWRGVEWTWYPSRKRYAPRALAHVQQKRRRGRVRPYLSLVVWPGFVYALHAGIDLAERQ